MASATGHMTTTDFSESAAIVQITVHKLDEFESTRLMSEFKAYLSNSGKTRIVMDYAEVEFVSSAGLGAMITMSRDVDGVGGKMILVGLNDNVLQVMKLTKLDKLLKIEKDLAKAQKKLLK